MKETAYILQAALISAWWIGLACSQSFFDAFQFEAISPTAYWAFLAPDMSLIALLSLVRAYRHENSLELVVLGAFAYGALYCVNASILTSSGLLPTGFMLAGLACNIFLCFNQSHFRVSKSKNVATNGLKTLIQIACIWVLALLVVPYVLLDAFGSRAMPTIGMVTIAGALLFSSFSVLGLTSSFFMVRDGDGTPLPLDQTNNLVVSGPYRYVRNPMAIAGIGQGLAIAMIFQSIPIMVYSLLGAIVWHFVVRPFEEHDMTCRFGDPYLTYRNRVSCWLPMFRHRNE